MKKRTLVESVNTAAKDERLNVPSINFGGHAKIAELSLKEEQTIQIIGNAANNPPRIKRIDTTTLTVLL